MKRIVLTAKKYVHAHGNSKHRNNKPSIELQNFKNFQEFQSSKKKHWESLKLGFTVKTTKLQIKDMRIKNKIIKIMYNINR